MKKVPWKKMTTVGLVTSFVAVNTLYGLANFALWKGLRPKRIPNTVTPKDSGLYYEDVSFQSNDGLTLKGWWIPAKNSERTIIFSHGYGLNRSTSGFSVFRLAAFLHQAGYNILVYDFRNSGESEGTMASIAQKEQYDVLAAIDFVKEEKQAKQIVLMGWSMGASASLLAGSQSDDVVAIIADSPFAKLDTYLQDSFTHWTKLPRFVGKLFYPFSTLNPFGFRAKNVRPLQAVKEAKQKSILLIHAKNDPTISYQESVKIKEVYPLAEFWNPDDGLHIESYRVYPTEYEQRVLQFLQQLNKKTNE